MAYSTKNLLKGNPDTQFKSGQRAVEMGRKGGQAFAANKRRKDTLRKNLKWMLALKPQRTEEMNRALIKLGYDPEKDYTIEDLITVGVLQKALGKDLNAIDMIYQYLAEDPHSIMEEKKLAVQKEAVEAIKNSDGFMEAMKGTVEEVFEDGGDTPDALEDT